MAKRSSSKPKESQSKNAKSRSLSNATNGAIEQRVVAVAEQIGRIVGTVQARTEGWLSRKGSGSAAAKPRTTARARSGGVVDAPGKRHRRPMPSQQGVKHSDTRIAKVKTSNESRRRGGGR
jgi:hypothetical protein